MQGLDKPLRLLVGGGVQNLPLALIERGCGEDRRRDRKAVGSEIFEQSERERKRGDRSSRGRPQVFVNARRFASDGLERLGDHRTVAARPGAGDKIDQLTPAHRCVVPILGRLIQHRQQTIVEAHCLLVSSGRTLLSLYARIDIALRSKSLTAP